MDQGLLGGGELAGRHYGLSRARSCRTRLNGVPHDGLLHSQSEMRRHVLPPESRPETEGRHVKERDEGNEQQGRRENHGSGGLRVATLESDVINVKPQM